MRAPAFNLVLLLALAGCFPQVEDKSEVRTSASGSDDDSGAIDTAPPAETGETDTDPGDTDPGDTDTEDTEVDETGDTEPTGPVDADGDGALSDVDCDDTNADVVPGGGEGHTGDARGRDDDCDGEIDEFPTVEFTTDSSRVWVYLADTWPGDWWFGMAETGAGDDGWYGEDCIDDPADDADYGYEFCHPFDGTDLTLRHSSTLGDVTEGEVTLFYDDLLPDVTFYLATEDEALCWVWGDDPDWYVTDSHGGAGPFDCAVE